MMHSVYSAITLCILWVSFPNFGSCFPQEIVTYKELEDMEANCHNLDTCTVIRKEDRLDRLNCNCGSFCAELDTCCIDSPYRSTTAAFPDKRLTCAAVYKDTTFKIFMIDSCQPGRTGNSAIEGLCKADAETANDPILMIPVTSRQTGITYRNYFCFMCNNDGPVEMPVFWNIRLGSHNNIQEKSSFPALTYDRKAYSWTIEDARTGGSVPVEVKLEYGTEIQALIRTCRTGVISQCSPRWEDEIVRSKCSAYMAIVIIYNNGTRLYRNPHCAVCNNEDLTRMDCTTFSVMKTGKKPFSFALLLDVNRSDGDVVGEVQRCDSQSLYDPFFKKCRVLKCALPGYSLKNGKCSQD